MSQCILELKYQGSFFLPPMDYQLVKLLKLWVGKITHSCSYSIKRIYYIFYVESLAGTVKL